MSWKGREEVLRSDLMAALRLELRKCKKVLARLRQRKLVSGDDANVDSEGEQFYIAQIGKTEDALRRVENGDFRECVDCHGTIGVERFAENPAQLLCERCASIRAL